MFRFINATVLPNVSIGSYHVDWESAGNEEAVFKIYYSRENEGPWILVNQYSAPAVDVALDALNLNFVDPIYFIVKAYGKTSHALLASSDVIVNAFIPEKGHYLRYKEIIRRTYLDISKYKGGRKIYLFRLKTYGAAAGNVNPILGMPIGEETANAYGQKFDGGYFDPIEIFCGVRLNTSIYAKPV